jgi:LPS sulfotransferase NodH
VTRACLLICTVPRSGSWLLADALDRTNRCGRPREYFRPDYQKLYLEAWHSSDVRSYTEYVALALTAATTPNGMGAVKLHWDQFRHLLRCLRESPGLTDLPDRELVDRVFPDARYVHLVREDKPAQAVSWYRAIHSGHWWRLPRERAPARKALARPVFSELQHLELALLDAERGWQAYFATNRIEPMVVTYEELSADYRDTIRRVLSGLQIDGATRIRIPPPRLRRQADAESERWLARYRREREATHDQVADSSGETRGNLRWPA